MSRVPARLSALAVLGALCAVAACSGGERVVDEAASPRLALESYELANGLNVILLPDQALPEVAVNLWYHVGSRNETPGRRGFAHVYEHLMFKGSAHHDRDLLPALRAIGGRGNGMTNKDRTVYWSVVPPERLETALWLESDRMGFLLEALTQEKLDRQISVILNELARNADRPYARTDEWINTLLFPPEHPYSWTVAGVVEELAAATRGDVADFFRRYYVPDNASLCIAGRFDPTQAREWIDTYFGDLPPGPPRERLTAWAPRLQGERRLTAADDVAAPRLILAWHTPARFDAGDAEFDVLANILADGADSRLRRVLQHDAHLAQDIQVRQRSRELGSTFEIVVTAAQGTALAEVEAVVANVVATIADQGVEKDEVATARAMLEADFTRGLEQVGGFGGRANRVNRYRLFRGEADWLENDLRRVREVTAESVQQAVLDHLGDEQRAVLHIVPAAEAPDAERVTGPPVSANSGSREVVATKPAAGQFAGAGNPPDRGTPPPAAEAVAYALPSIRSGALDNGMRFFVVERRGLPLVEVHLNVLTGGPMSGPMGVAALTAEMLDEGAAGRAASGIARSADALGARLECGSNFDASLVELNVRRADLAAGLDLAADLVREPDFPAEALQRLREEHLGRGRMEAKRPRTVAIWELQRRIFGPGHTYAQSYTGTVDESSLEAIGRDDLQAFHRARYRPGNVVAVLVGDVGFDEARGLLEEKFGDWSARESTAGQGSRIVQEPVPEPTGAVIVLDRPGSRQGTIVGGAVSVPRAHPDREALLLLNQALGRDAAGRLGRNLRAEKGLTYQVRSRVINYRDAGFFLVESTVDPQRTAEALAEVKRELGELGGTRPVAGEELMNAVAARQAGFVRGFETLASTATNLDRLIVCGRPPDAWESVPAAIDACTAEGLARLAAEHLDPGRMVWIVVGDWTVMRPAFEARGIEPVEIREF